MNNLIFSINVVLPVFIMILLGMIGAYLGVLERPMMEKLARITFTWFLSVKIALSTYDVDILNMTAMPMTLFCSGGLLVMFGVIWFLAHRLIKDSRSVGSFVHCSFRGSITVLGLALAQNLAGDAGVAMCAPLIAVGSFENNILAVICLSENGEKGAQKNRFTDAAVQIVKNPMIIGAAAGLAANLINLPCPQVIRTPLNYLSQLAVPLSLLCIGSALEWKKISGTISYSLAAALVKTVGLAAVMMPVAVLCGFRGTELAVIGFYFMLANPSGTYVMTLSMNGNAELAAGATVLSTFLSVFTITLMLFIIRSMGLM